VIVVQSVPATRRENVLSRHHDRESTTAGMPSATSRRAHMDDKVYAARLDGLAQT
jgi:hypothetical protein